MNSREKRRFHRLDVVKTKIRNSIEKNELMTYEKLIAFCITEFGVERRKAKEYIEPWIELYELEEKEGKLCVKTY